MTFIARLPTCASLSLSIGKALPHEPLGALVRHNESGPFLIRVRYVLANLSDSDFTAWQSADSSVVVLGLAAGGLTKSVCTRCSMAARSPAWTLFASDQLSGFTVN